MGRRKGKVCAPRGEEYYGDFRYRSRFRTSALSLGAARSEFVHRRGMLGARPSGLARWRLRRRPGQRHVGTCKAVKMRGELQVVGRSAPLALPFSPAIFLTQRGYISRLTPMEVHLKPETESRLNELASRSGLPTDDLMEDAMAGAATTKSKADA